MTKKVTGTKELTVGAPEGYLVLQNFDFHKAVAEEMDGLTACFDRIKMPSGDTTVFQVPSEDPDEPELVREITAVILYHHPIRAYFKEKYTGATVPPDCGSLNAVEGHGEPGASASIASTMSSAPGRIMPRPARNAGGSTSCLKGNCSL